MLNLAAAGLTTTRRFAQCGNVRVIALLGADSCRHCNANLVEIRIIPKCIRLWLQRLSRPSLATSARRGRLPNGRWRTRQVG